MRNIRLDICYDGSRYQGWQRQAGEDNTIQGKLEKTLSRILGEEIQISGSGRTDAGVHAKAQVANFHCNSSMDCAQILSELRRYLPEDIGINSCREASERFHARLNARQKTYCYRVWNSQMPCVFDRKFVHILADQLDMQAMEQAAAQLLGRHDFSAFCSKRSKKKSTERTILSIRIERVGHEIRFYFTGDGFLHNMVRILTGTLLEVGLGERDAATVAQLFGANREEAGAMVPAKGLCLEEVVY